MRGLVRNLAGSDSEWAENATIHGPGGLRVLFVRPGANVTIDGLTINGGDGFVAGTGILNAGSMRIRNSTISGNATTFSGGGIYNRGEGTLMVENSRVTGNSAGETGGGIHNDGTLTLVDASVSGNTGGAGGGILNSAFGTLTLTRVTTSGNSGGFGGGVTSNGTLTIQDSAIVSNRASGGGGGLAIGSGVALVDRATIASNSAGTDGGGVNYAGGLYAGGLPPVLMNVTIFDNGAGTSGGGIANTGYIGSMKLENATIAANRATVSGGAVANLGYSGEVALSGSMIAASIGAPNCIGPITDGGYNLDDGTSCDLSSAAGSLAGADPRLDPSGLKDNGGPTPTVALQPDSPAIDAIPYAANGCGTTLAKDQRGTTRPQGSGCDIGAFELVPRTAAQQLDDLIALVNSYALHRLGTSLQDKLASAKRLLLAGKPRQAGEKLAAFTSEVEAQRGTALTEEQADALTGAARQLIDLIKA